jgi:hypothetical protein
VNGSSFRVLCLGWRGDMFAIEKLRNDGMNAELMMIVEQPHVI